MLAATFAAASSTEHAGLLCTILLFATVIAFILGLLELLGVYAVGGARAGNGRFGALVVAIVLLLAYIFFC